MAGKSEKRFILAIEVVAKIVVKIVANIAVLSLHHLAHIVCHSLMIFKKALLAKYVPITKGSNMKGIQSPFLLLKS